MTPLPHRLVPFPLSPLFLLVAIFFLNFTCRIILAPLLPIITRDLSLGYGGAGSLFFLAGAFADRIGYRRSLAISLTATGALTVLLGVAQGRVLTPILLLLQAPASVCFFPVAYSLLSTMFPLAQRGLAVSLVTIVGGLFGSGVLPSALGYIAEVSSFCVGITLMGLLTLAMALLLRSPSPKELNRQGAEIAKIP